MANIRPEVLIPAAPELRARVAAGGRLLLSGILVEEAPAVLEAYRRQGLIAVPAGPPSPAQVRGEWQAVELRVP